MSFLAQMLRFPLTVFVYSMEALVHAMRDIQKNTDHTINAMVGGVTQALSGSHGNGNGSSNSQVAGGAISDNAKQTTEREESKMSDQDLSGDDLKYVSYSILFTKRDLEATLEEQKEELVSYPTNGGSYGGLKIAHFMKKVLEGKVKRPPEWKNLGNHYPPGAKGDYFTEIPSEDERYITFVYNVVRRIPREQKEYDREKVRALKGIRESIDKVGDKIGP